MFKGETLPHGIVTGKLRMHTGGEPMISAQTASRAMRIFWYDPSMCIRVSASTMRVRVAFSIVNFVFPFYEWQMLVIRPCQLVNQAKQEDISLARTLPASRPMHRDRCSPRNVCRNSRCLSCKHLVSEEAHQPDMKAQNAAG